MYFRWLQAFCPTETTQFFPSMKVTRSDLLSSCPQVDSDFWLFLFLFPTTKALSKNSTKCRKIKFDWVGLSPTWKRRTPKEVKRHFVQNPPECNHGLLYKPFCSVCMSHPIDRKESPVCVQMAKPSLSSPLLSPLSLGLPSLEGTSAHPHYV